MRLPIRLAMLAALVIAAAPGGAFAQTRDLAREEANRRLVVEFYERVFTRHDVAEAAATVLTEDYIQHNPRVPSGREPFVKFFTGYFKDNPAARNRIVRSATDGDLVVLHVHSTANETDRGRAIVDIFRVRDGRIVEHWDVIQPVPETSANGNGMF
jgi:predicted SnoaL-like aldol condensation-catalyzing enzyme